MRTTLHSGRLTFVILIVSILMSSVEAYGLTMDRVLATVGDEMITSSDYKQFVKDIGVKGTGDAIDEKLLRSLIEEKIIRQEAKRRGIEVNDIEVEKAIEEFKAKNGVSQEDLEQSLAAEGMDMKSYRKLMKEKIMSSKLISDDVDSKIVITDKEVKEYYDLNRKDFLGIPERVEIKAIFIKLKEDISVTEITDLKLRTLKIVSRLRGGDSFDKLADDYSDEPLRSQGGVLGKFARGTLIPPLDDKAFSMKEGEISDPIWVSEGVYILRLTRKSGDSFKKLEEVRAEILDYLYKQKREKLFNEWIKTLWERSAVTIRPS